VRRVHHSAASCASVNGATSRCGRAAHRVRACCRRNSGSVLGAAARLNSPKTLRPLVPPLAATDFLQRKFPVITVVADGRVYTIEEFDKQWWTRRPRSSALVPRDTPGIRDCDEGVTLISCWLSFFQYQSHVGLFEAISANARTRHPRSTHSHAFCLAGEKRIEDLRQFVFGNARAKSRDAQLPSDLTEQAGGAEGWTSGQSRRILGALSGGQSVFPHLWTEWINSNRGFTPIRPPEFCRAGPPPQVPHGHAQSAQDTPVKIFRWRQEARHRCRNSLKP